MTEILQAALRYAAAGFRVFPLHSVEAGRCSCGRQKCISPGKHPRTRNGVKDATTDPEQIRKWWTRWPTANIGFATGQGVVVIDIDGPANLAVLAELGPLPETLTSQTGRGAHLYYRGNIQGSKTVAGLLVRGEGGYVILPPSVHHSGKKYAWIRSVSIARLPPHIQTWLQSAGGTRVSGTLKAGGADMPDHLVKRKQADKEIGSSVAATSVASRALKALGPDWSAEEEARIRGALGAIPANCGRDQWLTVGMALHALGWDLGGTGGESGDRGFELWAEWSATGGEKFQGLHDLETRWRSFRRSGVTIGTLFHMAKEAGWVDVAALPTAGVPKEESGLASGGVETPHEAAAEPPNGHPGGAALLPGAFTAKSPESPLIRLNEKYAVIGDVGGKCLVMGWVPGKVDEAIAVPSFQSFKSFSERYANQYVMIPGEDKQGNKTEEAKQIGPYWLKWSKRRSYEGIDLVPGGPATLPGGQLNLWSGFAVPPAAPQDGSAASAEPPGWPRMQEHIVEVLAGGDQKAAEYIFRFAAWAVQHPGERAEAALVFRGGKGSGKGTFANALKRLFGQHGLQIFNSKHLVGAFNGHLRNCLLLFADEAFWAGDKQGESVLKGLLTEPALMIEQKGIDAAPWKNRLHVIMAANAEWVVPASHDERRYAMFDVSGERIGDERYFEALHAELREGGLSAMLHDLLAVDLKDWHPRRVIQTEALRLQKERSMDPRFEWWESVLQDGHSPVSPDTKGYMNASNLLDVARANSPRLRDLSSTAFGRFLRERGAVGIHRNSGNVWKLPPLLKARSEWSRRFKQWVWRNELKMWNDKPFEEGEN